VSPIGGIPGGTFSAVELPTCGCAPADFTSNANATLNSVQLLISGTTCRPETAGQRRFQHDNASAR
jgi:hypothetical protein